MYTIEKFRVTGNNNLEFIRRIVNVTENDFDSKIPFLILEPGQFDAFKYVYRIYCNDQNYLCATNLPHLFD
jgi:hypothetical protein